MEVPGQKVGLASCPGFPRSSFDRELLPELQHPTGSLRLRETGTGSRSPAVPPAAQAPALCKGRRSVRLVGRMVRARCSLLSGRHSGSIIKTASPPKKRCSLLALAGRPGNPQFPGPFPRFPIWPGNGKGIPVSRFRVGRDRENRETGVLRYHPGPYGPEWTGPEEPGAPSPSGGADDEGR
jgi:hypothetical protein